MENLRSNIFAFKSLLFLATWLFGAVQPSHAQLVELIPDQNQITAVTLAESGTKVTIPGLAGEPHLNLWVQDLESPLHISVESSSEEIALSGGHLRLPVEQGDVVWLRSEADLAKILLEVSTLEDVHSFDVASVDDLRAHTWNVSSEDGETLFSMLDEYVPMMAEQGYQLRLQFDTTPTGTGISLAHGLYLMPKGLWLKPGPTTCMYNDPLWDALPEHLQREQLAAEAEARKKAKLQYGSRCGNIATLYSALRLGWLEKEEVMDPETGHLRPEKLLELDSFQRTAERGTPGMTDHDLHDAHEHFNKESCKSTVVKSEDLDPSSTTSSRAQDVLEGYGERISREGDKIDCTLQTVIKLKNGKNLGHVEHITSITEKDGKYTVDTVDGTFQGAPGGGGLPFADPTPGKPGHNQTTFEAGKRPVTKNGEILSFRIVCVIPCAE